jgi:hypothetical protein
MFPIFYNVIEKFIQDFDISIMNWISCMNKKYTFKTIIKIILVIVIFIIIPIRFFIKKDVVNIISGWLTFLAIVTALFKDQIAELLLSPELYISVYPTPEYFHEINAKFAYQGLPAIQKQAWLGLKVENLGWIKAKNVMVYFTGLSSNRVVNFQNFKTIPMKRSWINNPIIELLPPKIGIRFDICYLIENIPSEIHFDLFATPTEMVGIRCPQNQDSYFEFNAIAVADNSKITTKKIRVIFRGNYVNGFLLSTLD